MLKFLIFQWHLKKLALRRTQKCTLNLNLVLVGKGFRHKRDDVCHRSLLDFPIKVLQDPLKKRKYDMSESIDFRGKSRV